MTGGQFVDRNIVEWKKKGGRLDFTISYDLPRTFQQSVIMCGGGRKMMLRAICHFEYLAKKFYKLIDTFGDDPIFEGFLRSFFLAFQGRLRS